MRISLCYHIRMSDLTMRAANAEDEDAVWHILEPTFREGATYPIPQNVSREEGLAYWFAPGHSVFVAEADGGVVGTYYLRANNRGGGAHVANCGFMTARQVFGRGVARQMCLHSLDEARKRRFTAMQFNFVIASNKRAVKLWQSCGFRIVGTLPDAFVHPEHGPVDAYVMFREL
jgi:ribosomal protein S18 acetylase RimI-like enzyme